MHMVEEVQEKISELTHLKAVKKVPVHFSIVNFKLFVERTT